MRARSLAALTALSFGFSMPSYALEPDALWQQWSAWLETQEGVSIGAQNRTDTGWAIEDITLTRARDAGRDSSVTIPSLMLDSDDGAVVVTAPDGMTVTGTDDTSLPDTTLVVDLSDATATFTDATNPGLLGMLAMAAEGRVGVTTLQEEGTNPSPSTQAELTGLSLTLPGGSFDGNAQATLTVDSVTMAQGEQGEAVVVRSEAEGVEAILNLSNIQHFHAGDPIAAIAQGSDLHLSYAQDRGTYALKDTTQDSWNRWNDLHLTFDIDREGLRTSSTLNGVEMGGNTTHEGGSGAFGAAADRLHSSVSVPLFAKDAPQTASVLLDTEGLTISGQGNTFNEALQDTLQEPSNASIDAQASLTLDGDLWPASRDAEPDMSGIRIHTVRVPKATLDALGGMIALDGTLRFGDQPLLSSTPTSGEALVTITQADVLLDGLETLQIIDPAQRAQAELLLRAFALPDQPEPATYTIKLTEDGTTTINDNPL